MWGQALARINCVQSSGIIPTRVGTRCRKADINALSKDHPHACGDKLYVESIAIPVQGSSPRVWGQANYLFIRTVKGRIIPTRVGTRVTAEQFPNLAEDHPHACGDKFDFYKISACVIGSSPRVWGQVGMTEKIYNFVRIIPTRVGTRDSPADMCCNFEDHPHACGDKFHVNTLAMKPLGSSPRVWGQD